MPDTKITDLTALAGASVATTDVFVVVDVSDTTMAASGTDKKITQAELVTGLGIDAKAAASDLTNHLNDTTDAHDASAISFTPAGAVAATDVQAAIAELDTEKSATGHTHSAGALDDLTDVTITAAASGDIVRYNGSAWVDYPDSNYAAAGHSHTAPALDDLTDVTITGASNGQVLKFNGSAWINDTDATGGGGGALDDLTDVTITSAASGDLLRYNGSAWVDYADSNFSAAAHTHAYVAESVLDANTVLYATTDNTPAALAVAASRIVGRKASGDIVALTGAETGTIIDVAGKIIGYTAYNPSTELAVATTSATYADVDATNLQVTFTAPASGNVLVTLDGYHEVAAPSSSIGWNLRSGSSDVSGMDGILTYTITTGTWGYQYRTCVTRIVTGLTPGASYTYKWGHARVYGSATVKTRMGGTGILGAGLMIVTAL